MPIASCLGEYVLQSSRYSALSPCCSALIWSLFTECSCPQPSYHRFDYQSTGGFVFSTKTIYSCKRIRTCASLWNYGSCHGGTKICLQLPNKQAPQHCNVHQILHIDLLQYCMKALWVKKIIHCYPLFLILNKLTSIIFLLPSFQTNGEEKKALMHRSDTRIYHQHIYYLTVQYLNGVWDLCKTHIWLKRHPTPSPSSASSSDFENTADIIEMHWVSQNAAFYNSLRALGPFWNINLRWMWALSRNESWKHGFLIYVRFILPSSEVK